MLISRRSHPILVIPSLLGILLLGIRGTRAEDPLDECTIYLPAITAGEWTTSFFKLVNVNETEAAVRITAFGALGQVLGTLPDVATLGPHEERVVPVTSIPNGAVTLCINANVKLRGWTALRHIAGRTEVVANLARISRTLTFPALSPDALASTTVTLLNTTPKHQDLEVLVLNGAGKTLARSVLTAVAPMEGRQVALAALLGRQESPGSVEMRVSAIDGVTGFQMTTGLLDGTVPSLHVVMPVEGAPPVARVSPKTVGHSPDLRAASITQSWAATADPVTALVPWDPYEQPDPNDKRIPLVLIHGIHGTEDSNHNQVLDSYEANLSTAGWSQFNTWFAGASNDTLTKRYKLYRFHYISDVYSVLHLADSLASRIDSAVLSGAMRDSEIVIVAHSMGGLVSRFYMNRSVHNVGYFANRKGGERVRRLITLATPHHGSPLSNGDIRSSSVIWRNVLSFADTKYWSAVGCPACGNDPAHQNRSDLRFDNYNNMWPSTAYNTVTEANALLIALDKTYDSKLVAYSGTIGTSQGIISDLSSKNWLEFNTIIANIASMSDADHAKLISLSILLERMMTGNWDSGFNQVFNDGMVPYESASYSGGAVAKRISCANADHLDMLEGITGACGTSTSLFPSVGNELLTVLPLYEGYLDVADCNSDVIAGWVWDQSSVASNVLQVELFDGTTSLGTQAVTRFRQDLKDAGKGDGYHGFQFVKPSSLKDGKPHTIHVKVVGTDFELGNSPRTLNCSLGSNYEGYMGADCSTVTGWAADRNNLNQSISVEIWNGATKLTSTPILANLSRPDVGSYLGDNGNHGFNWTIPQSLKDGQAHAITVKVAGTSQALGGSPASITCYVVPAASGFDYPVGDANGNGWLNNRGGLWWLEQYNYGGSCGLTYHPGIDFNKDGTSGDQDRYEPVYAVAGGVVVASGQYTSTWGNIVLIEHELANGQKVWSQYGHLEDRLVAVGQTVSRRQQIGRVGKGDGSLAAHLHFEIRTSNMSPSAFPCGQTQAYVTARYTDPIAFIDSHRSGPVSSFEGYVDNANCDFISGWAADKSKLNQSINVEIWEGSNLITTVPANQNRSDVGGYLKDNGNHGFSLATPASLKGGSHSFQIRFGGSTTQLANSPKTLNCVPNPPQFEGYVDNANCDFISGWAADKSKLNQSINVEIWEGSNLITTVPANQNRSDVGGYLKDNGNHGFSLATPASLKGGSHSFQIRFGGSTTQLANSPKTLNCGASYEGYLDGVSCSKVYGWVWDPAQPTSPLNVELYNGSSLLTTVSANELRSDLAAAGKGNGYHAFNYVPTSLSDGQSHSISAKVAGTQFSLGNSPRTLSGCTGSNPTVSSVSISPSTIASGASATMTVTLSGAAPSGGAVISLSANNSGVSVPSSLTIAAGQTTGNYTVYGSMAITSTATTTVTATYNNSSRNASITVIPPVLPTVSSISISPSTIGTGVYATVTITLSGPAPVGGAQVSLSTNNSAFPVTSNLLIPAGQSSGSFNAQASTSITSTTTTTVTATYNNSSRSANVTVTVAPPSVFVSCSISPNPITLGQGATVTSQGSGGTPPYTLTTNGTSGSSSFIIPQTAGTYTATASVIDSRGQSASTTCTAQVIIPTPTLSSLQPSTSPKANQAFNLTINGTGFATGVAVYLCSTQSYPGNCFSHPVVNIASPQQLSLPSVQWNSSGTIYIIAVNSGSLKSNFLPLTVSP